MLLSAVSVLVVAQSSSEIPEGLMNNPVYWSPSQEIRWILWNQNIHWRVYKTVSLGPLEVSFSQKDITDLHKNTFPFLAERPPPPHGGEVHPKHFVESDKWW